MREALSNFAGCRIDGGAEQVSIDFWPRLSAFVRVQNKIAAAIYARRDF